MSQQPNQIGGSPSSAVEQGQRRTAAGGRSLGAGGWRNLGGLFRSWLGTVAVIVVLIVFFSVTQPRFLTLLNWQNIAVQMSVLLVISLAGTLPILIGSIDLSVGSVATLAGIILAVTSRNFREVAAQGAILAIPIALLIGLACGLLNGLLFAVMRVPSFLTTLGTFFALDGVASFIIGGTPIPLQFRGAISTLFDSKFGIFPVIFLWALAVLVLIALVCRYTRLGRHFYAVGGSDQAAFMSGVNVKRVKLVAFALSGLLAGFSGVLLTAHALSGSPGQSAPLLLPSIGAVVIGGTALSGGVGGPHRTFLGVLLLTILINGMQLLSVDPFLQLVIEGFVVIAAVILGRPKVSGFATVR